MVFQARACRGFAFSPGSGPAGNIPMGVNAGKTSFPTQPRHSFTVIFVSFPKMLSGAPRIFGSILRFTRPPPYRSMFCNVILIMLQIPMKVLKNRTVTGEKGHGKISLFQFYKKEIGKSLFMLHKLRKRAKTRRRFGQKGLISSAFRGKIILYFYI